MDIADYLLPDNLTRYDKGEGKTMIVCLRRTRTEKAITTASDGHQVDLPIAVLINGESASASRS